LILLLGWKRFQCKENVEQTVFRESAVKRERTTEEKERILHLRPRRKKRCPIEKKEFICALAS